MTDFARERYLLLKSNRGLLLSVRKGNSALGISVRPRLRLSKMVDIHCHILPGIDDGPQSWELTAAMCHMAASDGITHIVATPHCNHEFAYDRDHYTEMLGQLSDAAEGKLTFSLGCDFHFSYDNIQDALAHPRRYTIGESQYLLVEFSDFGIPPKVKQNLLFISSSGMVPIITHPERNQVLLRQPETVLQFVEQGCLVQITANSLTGFWGSRSKEMAEWLLKHEAVHVIASDAHDSERRRPVLSEAREAVTKLVGREVAQALVTHNPAAIVQDQRLPCQPVRRPFHSPTRTGESTR